MKKQFICTGEERCTMEHHVPAPMFRKTFELKKIPRKAEFKICGLGFYLLFVNGKDITKGYLAPYISNPDDRMYVDEYDLLPYLQKGENVIGVILGNGFMNAFGGIVWDFDKAAWIASPRLACEFNATGNGVEIHFNADKSFRTHPSAWEYDEFRFGEIFNAQNELLGWNAPDFDDSDWNPAIPTNAPQGIFCSCQAEPIVVRKLLNPVSVTKTDTGYLYDFGENTAGVCRLKLRNAAAGQTLTIRFCERLKDGKFDQTNLYNSPEQFPFYLTECQKCIYVAKKADLQEWEQKFSWYGFRYIEVQGITDEQATEDLLEYRVLSSDIPEIGHFSCSDETVNRIFGMMKNADLSNFYYFPTDCPHREKNGWTGDASMSADHMTALFDTENSYTEWLRNIVDAQNEEGALPGIVPTGGWGFAWGNGPAWDSVLFHLPYVLSRYRGSLTAADECANAMMKYLRYIQTKRNADGLYALGLGDWVPVGRKSGHYPTPLVVTASIFVMTMAREAAELMRAIGQEGFAEEAKQLYHQTRKSIREKLMDSSTKRMLGNTQTAQAMAIYYGVFEKSEENDAFERLLELLESNGNKFDCGFLGMHTLFDVLSDHGRSDLAYDMIMSPEFPSYRHLIDIGETAMVESFQPDGGRECGSHNHHFLCDAARWFIYDLAGLQIENSHTVKICPSFLPNLDQAEASYDFPDGTVSVHWERKKNEILMKISSPKEITITVDTSKSGKIPVYVTKKQ